jgi:hypothetical protein
MYVKQMNGIQIYIDAKFMITQVGKEEKFDYTRGGRGEMCLHVAHGPFHFVIFFFPLFRGLFLFYR